MTDTAPIAAGGAGTPRPLLGGPVRTALLALERGLARVESAFGIIAMAALALLLVFQVFIRYVANSPLFWIEEVARLTMIWMVLIGIGFIIATGAHLTVTAIVDRMPHRVGICFERLGFLVMIAAGIALAIAGAELADKLGGVNASSSGLSRSLYFLPTMIGYGLAVVHAAIALLTRPAASAAKLQESTPEVMA